jgi:hypothetical protein
MEFNKNDADVINAIYTQSGQTILAAAPASRFSLLSSLMN